MKITTRSDQYSVAPGGRLEISVILINEEFQPDQVRVQIEGIPLVWVTAEQQVVVLQPGEMREITLVVQPPEPPNVVVGRHIMSLRAVSTIDPDRVAFTKVNLTVTGFEVKGRVAVLLEGIKFSVTPGDRLAIPVVLINQGLGLDTFRLSVEELPEGWVTITDPEILMQPGEVRTEVINLHPARHSSSRASRYPFHITVSSQEAADQSASISCILTVAGFVDFRSELLEAQPEQKLPDRVSIHNLSNMPASFTLTWSSPEDSLTFEPEVPQHVNLQVDEVADLEYSAKPASRMWIGGEKSYPYTVDVSVAGSEPQKLESSLKTNGLIPVWAAAGAAILVLVCLCLGFFLFRPGFLGRSNTTETPVMTSTATIILPTATTSQIDQRDQLIERRWYLASYNETLSSPGAQEPFTLFNPNGTYIGHTGCKDLSGNYTTSFNQITISALNLSSGSCLDSNLQRQEDAMVAILRSARSYFVADTALQIGGDAGFLNYSLSPLNRPEEIQPPQASIRAVPQSEAGQIVVFESTSTGEVPLVSWVWDFGDGTSASGPVVQHVFRNAGTFSVRLTVTDQRNQTSAATHQIHILAVPTAPARPTDMPPPPTAPPPTLPPAQPTYTPIPPEPPTQEPLPEKNPPQAVLNAPRSGFIGEPVAFDASSSQPGSSPIVSFTWSFGNGEGLPASPAPNVSATYNTAGVFEVTVVVLDANGLSSYTTSNIEIDARLETSVWTLSNINGQPLVPGTAITSQFLNGQITGFSGCNTYDGSYSAADNGDGTINVSIERLSTSRLSCPGDIMNQENVFISALERVTLAVIQENRITLNYPDGALVFYLVFRP